MNKQQSNTGELVIYQTTDGQTKIDVKMVGENIWLTQKEMAVLFGTNSPAINKHLKNIYYENELIKSATCSKMEQVQIEGNRQIKRQVDFYNLDAIIAVGYRVNSLRATQFRIWATQTLKEYLIKGFVMNDDLLKEAGGGIHWQELLERIRDIRSSEKVFYRQVLDLYATSADYDPKAAESIKFFKVVQNKIHYAAHGQTAAEVIFSRVNADLPHMGLTSFKHEKPLKSDTEIAKNYLTEKELKKLNRLVSAFFDLAELRAENHQPMYMKDWLIEIDDFAARYGQGKLITAGKITHRQALQKAHQEYKKYQYQTKDELSQVERAFLASVKEIEKKVERVERK